MSSDSPCLQYDNKEEDDIEAGARLSEVDKRNIFIYKLLKQACIVSTWFLMGLFEEVIGPTLPDLADSISVNYEEIARALSTKAIGLFAGSLVGGFMHEIFYHHTDLIMSLGLLLGAIGMGITPHSQSLGLVAFLFALTGVSEGIVNTGGNTLVLHIWGEKAASPMHSTHFGFGIGAIIAAQIALPFLVESPEGNTTVTPSPNITSAPNVAQSRLDYPYGIIAVLSSFVAFLYLVFYFKKPPKGFTKMQPPPLSLKTLLSPATCSGKGRVGYGAVLLAVLFMYFMHATGGERAYGKYIPAFSQESSLQFTKTQSANLASVFWVCHVLGRFSGILLSRWVPTPVIILADSVLLMATTVMLASFGYNNTTAIWILTGVLGYSISLFFPCGMAWANLQLDMNSMATMVMLMGAAIGGLVYQYLPGYLMITTGTRSLMWVMVTYAALLALTFGLMTVISKVWGDGKLNSTEMEEDKAKEDEYKTYKVEALQDRNSESSI